MQSQQLDHRLDGRPDVLQGDFGGLAGQVLVNTEQSPNPGAVERLHLTQVNDDKLDPRLQEPLALALEFPRGGRIQPRGFDEQVECLILQLSFNDGGHAATCVRQTQFGILKADK